MMDPGIYLFLKCLSCSYGELHQEDSVAQSLLNTDCPYCETLPNWVFAFVEVNKKEEDE